MQKARLDIGRVAEQTEPAKHMLEKIGFHYLNEVDPFDGGPHYGAKREEIDVVQSSVKAKLAFHEDKNFSKQAIIAAINHEGFSACFGAYELDNNGEAVLPPMIKSQMSLSEGQDIFIYPLT